MNTDSSRVLLVPVVVAARADASSAGPLAHAEPEAHSSRVAVAALAARLETTQRAIR